MAHEQSARATVTPIAASPAVTTVTAGADAACSTTVATVTAAIRTCSTTVTAAAAVPTCSTTVTTVVTVTTVAAEDSSVATVAGFADSAGSFAEGESVTGQQSCIRSLGGAIAEEDVDAIVGLLTNPLDNGIDAPFAH